MFGRYPLLNDVAKTIMTAKCSNESLLTKIREIIQNDVSQDDAISISLLLVTEGIHMSADEKIDAIIDMIERYN